MFSFIQQQRYKRPPAGWSLRSLTFWDCCQFACHDSPTIGWVLGGEGIDHDILSTALERAIRRRAPWLRGRLAKTESGSPLYELHVPPESSNVMPFTRSDKIVEGNLNLSVRYVADGTLGPVVDVLESFDSTILNPRTSVKGVDEYISRDLPLLHLHFLKAADATLMSVSWSHAVMDALGFAQVIEAWEEELREQPASPFENPKPETIFDFTTNVAVPADWLPPGWIKVTTWQFLKVIAAYLYELYTLPLFHGSIFIPNAVVDHWKITAAKELPMDQWVSRNDLVSAWIFKNGWSFFPESDWNTMFCSICFRGRHPLLPRNIISNTAKSVVMPQLTTRELRDMSLPQLALRLRKSLDPYEDEEYVAKVVAQEFKSMREFNGKPTSYPIGLVGSRICGITSWAKLGLSSPNFGQRITTISPLSYNTGRGCATIIDSKSGDWRVDYKLSKKAWGYMNEQLGLAKKRATLP